MDSLKRKELRLRGYDYSQNGAYFITICTKNKMKTLWDNAVGTASGRPHLSALGNIVEAAINNINENYPSVNVDKYIIMPNHIHMILFLSESTEGGRPMVVPTISRVINQLKGFASKQAGISLWQARFYEHIIRNNQDYLDTWFYIESNPEKWMADEYYN